MLKVIQVRQSLLHSVESRPSLFKVCYQINEMFWKYFKLILCHFTNTIFNIYLRIFKNSFKVLKCHDLNQNQKKIKK